MLPDVLLSRRHFTRPRIHTDLKASTACVTLPWFNLKNSESGIHEANHKDCCGCERAAVRAELTEPDLLEAARPASQWAA